MTAQGLRPRLLIVDDDPLFRGAVRAAVEADGKLEVVGEAATGAQALELMPRLLPDVVVLDFAMPVMDGREAALQIEQHWPWVRIVMLTGTALPRREDSDLRAHVSLLLPKNGVDFSTLPRRLRG